LGPAIHVSIPFFWGIYILKHMRVGSLPVDHAERTGDFSYFPNSSVQRTGKSSQTSAAVDGAQGLQASVGSGRDQAISFGRKQKRTGTEIFEKVGAQRTHIAACNRLNQCSSLLDQSHAINLQESLVGPHPRAVPARQDVTGYAHAEMIALKFVPTLRLSALLVLALLPPLLFAEESASTRTTMIVKADNRSGRLVRSVVVAPKVVTPEDPNHPEPAQAERAPALATSSLGEMIDSIAAKHEVEGPLVHSVIKAESNYNPLAVSPKGAQGLMQLIPSTAKRFGVANTFNAEQNIEGGVKYLKFLMDLYHNDYVKVIAAYNAGEAAVTRYGGVPPYAETRNYVYLVGKNLQTARQVAEVKNAAPKPEEPKPTAVASPDQPHSIQAVIGPDGKLYYKTQ
jgi:soluble lytic murein transglycosylase-like protein